MGNIIAQYTPEHVARLAKRYAELQEFLGNGVHTEEGQDEYERAFFEFTGLHTILAEICSAEEDMETFVITCEGGVFRKEEYNLYFDGTNDVKRVKIKEDHIPDDFDLDELYRLWTGEKGPKDFPFTIIEV